MNPSGPPVKCEEARPPPHLPVTTHQQRRETSFLPPHSWLVRPGMTPSMSSQIDHVPGAQAVCVDSRKPFLRNKSLYGCSYFGTIHRGRHLAALRLWELKGPTSCQRPLTEHGLGEGHLGKAAETGCGDRALRPRV